MNMKPNPMLAIVFLARAACRPAATEWTEREAPKYLRLDNAAVSVNVRFAAGSPQLLSADPPRLRGMAAPGAGPPPDPVPVAVRGGPRPPPARAAPRFAP